MPTTIAHIHDDNNITASGNLHCTDGYLSVKNDAASKKSILVSYTAADQNKYYDFGHIGGGGSNYLSFGVDDTVTTIDLWASDSSFDTLPTLPTDAPTAITLSSNTSSTVTISSPTMMSGPDGTPNVTNSSDRIIVSDRAYYAFFDGEDAQGVAPDPSGVIPVPAGPQTYTQVRFSRTQSNPTDLVDAPAINIRHANHPVVLVGFIEDVQHAYPAIVNPGAQTTITVLNTSEETFATVSVAGNIDQTWSWTYYLAKLAPLGGSYVVDLDQYDDGMCLINWDLTGDPRVVVMRAKLVSP